MTRAEAEKLIALAQGRPGRRKPRAFIRPMKGLNGELFTVTAYGSARFWGLRPHPSVTGHLGIMEANLEVPGCREAVIAYLMTTEFSEWEEIGR